MPEYNFDRGGHVMESWRYSDLDIFTAAYIEAAFWTSEAPGVTTEEWQAADEHDEGSIPGDVGFADLAPDTLRSIMADCLAWQEQWDGLLQRAYDADGYSGPEQAGHDYWLTRNGHDYWLTRNGHGAGFWDRPALAGPLGDALAEAARSAGGRYLYLGDDGRVYIA